MALPLAGLVVGLGRLAAPMARSGLGQTFLRVLLRDIATTSRNEARAEIAREAQRIVRGVMKSFRVTVDSRATLAHLNDVQRRKIPFCTAVALTRTGKELQKILEAEVRRVFHQPTPWVAKGTFVKPATKQSLTATVGFKDRQSLYIKEHVTSGRRGQKPFERALSGLGVLPSGFKAIPGAGMKLDSRGNPNRAQLREVFGALRSGLGRYGKRGKNIYRVDYFAIHPDSPSHLPPGLYKRINNRAIVPVLVFVPDAGYEKRLDLEALAAKHAQGIFNREFERAWAQYR